MKWRSRASLVVHHQERETARESMLNLGSNQNSKEKDDADGDGDGDPRPRQGNGLKKGTEQPENFFCSTAKKR